MGVFSRNIHLKKIEENLKIVFTIVAIKLCRMEFEENIIISRETTEQRTMATTTEKPYVPCSNNVSVYAR